MDQIRLRQLLKDPIYKKWFLQDPKYSDPGTYPQWALYVRRTPDSQWSRAILTSYKQGLKYVAAHVKEFHDMSITNRRHESRPPVVKIAGKRQYYLLGRLITEDMVNPIPDRATHKWCTFCRRPTVFAYFTNHPALGRVSGGERRCSICGARESFIVDYGRI